MSWDDSIGTTGLGYSQIVTDDTVASATPAFIAIDERRLAWYIHGICRERVVSQSSSNFDVREARLFRNNRSQAVRIPAEFEFSGTRVLIHKEGEKLIIESAPKARLVDILKGLAPLAPNDQFPDDLDTTLLPLKAVDL
jgi:antitoxin VapB